MKIFANGAKSHPLFSCFVMDYIHPSIYTYIHHLSPHKGPKVVYTAKTTIVNSLKISYNHQNEAQESANMDAGKLLHSRESQKLFKIFKKFAFWIVSSGVHFPFLFQYVACLWVFHWAILKVDVNFYRKCCSTKCHPLE